MPALKLRLSAPEALVDIARIPELTGHPRRRRDARDRRVHAPPRRRRERRRRRQRRRALAAAAGGIGDQQVRNRGTIGGSLAQADPHGDLPAVALALGAEIVVAERGGHAHDRGRRLLRRLLHDALADGELITEIRIPGGQSQGAYAKFSRRAQDWAIIAAAVSKGSGGWRVGLCGAAPRPCAPPASRARWPPVRRPADAAAHAGRGHQSRAGPRRLDRVQAPPRHA